MPYLGHTYTNKLLVVYLTFKFPWVSCTEGQPENQLLEERELPVLLGFSLGQQKLCAAGFRQCLQVTSWAEM